jgi:hypothetical protein
VDPVASKHVVSGSVRLNPLGVEPSACVSCILEGRGSSPGEVVPEEDLSLTWTLSRRSM